MLSERVQNYPEGYDKKPWCPYSKLVQISALLTGVELDPETFCYEEVEIPELSFGVLHLLRGARSTPKASCSILNKELAEQLKLVAEDVPPVDEDKINKEIDAATSYKAKKAVIAKHDPEREKYLKKQEILGRWRNVIFETCVSTPEGETNVHFRQIKSSEDLAEEEILSKVKDFKKALGKIVGFPECSLEYMVGKVENCPQAPKHRYERPFID